MEKRGWEMGGREEDGVTWREGGTWLKESWGAKKCDGNGWAGGKWSDVEGGA